MDKDTLYRSLNEGVLAERINAFKRNLEKNINMIKRFGGLGRIIPAFHDRHVVIAGAGPSLVKSFEYLKKYQGRREILIIATDMAFMPLVNIGIIPEFVITCETIPMDYFSGVDTGKSHLLAFSCCSNVNIRTWTGDISFYNWMIQGGEYHNLWEKAGSDLGFLATGNLVTTQAVSLALGCNISSLLLAGNDLGFADTFYARGICVYKNFKFNRMMPGESFDYNKIRRAREYTVKRGEASFYTNSQFLAAKMWLEELFQKKQVPVYDISTPGCSENFVKKIDVKDYFSRFEKRKRRRSR